jgi:hypothetical protein
VCSPKPSIMFFERLQFLCNKYWFHVNLYVFIKHEALKLSSLPRNLLTFFMCSLSMKLCKFLVSWLLMDEELMCIKVLFNLTKVSMITIMLGWVVLHNAHMFLVVFFLVWSQFFIRVCSCKFKSIQELWTQACLKILMLGLLFVWELSIVTFNLSFYHVHKVWHSKVWCSNVCMVWIRMCCSCA